MDKHKQFDIIPVPTLNDNYVWIVIDREHKAAIAIDPGEAKPVFDFLKTQQFSLNGILITHHHWDHINGVAELKNRFHCPVIGPETKSIDHITKPVRANQSIHIKPFPFGLQIIEIPGHTLDHIAYYSPGLLFCGDTLFSAGCGRVFEGTPEQMYTSLQKIAALPDETNIYCAHEYTLNNLRFAETVEPDNLHIKDRMAYVRELRKKNLPSLPSTLREEKLTNPFLRCESPEVIRQAELYAKQTLPTPLAVFIWVRKWKDGF